MSQLGPFRLAPFFSPRVWGTTDLRPWYDVALTEPVGEAWLTGDMCQVETGPLKGKTLRELASMYPEQLLGDPQSRDYPLLLKILFPHEKLSVQVHPDDTLATQFGETRGKTECWYVLDAKPGAAVSLGLKPGVTLEAIRAGVDDQTMEELLEQVPVRVGDMVFVDAGTVHAIGPGVTLLETQQNSDLTYRLYDYGRPRELHVENALQATRLQTKAGKIQPSERRDGQVLVRRLIDERYFRVDRLELEPGMAYEGQGEGTPEAVVAVAGTATLVATANEPVPVLRGQAVVVPASVSRYTLQADESCVLVRSVPPPLPA